MPRSKDPDSYPSGYRQLLAAGFNSRAPIQIPYPTKTEAHRKRASLYAFINAVDRRETQMQIEWADRDTPRYRQVSIRVEPAADPVANGWFLTLTNKNFTEDELRTQAFLASLPDDVKELKQTNAPAMADVLAAIAEAEATPDGTPLLDASPLNGSEGEEPPPFNYRALYGPITDEPTSGSEKSADAEGDKPHD